jgi:hypothetical protein
VDRHLGRFGDAPVEAGQERPAAGHHDALVHDVGDQLGRRLLDRVLDRVDDLGDGRLDGLADLVGPDLDAARQAGQQVAPTEGDALGVPLPGIGRPDRDLDVLRRALAEDQVVLAPGEGDDVLESQWRDMAVYIEEHATKDDIVVLVSNRLERVKELPQSSLRLTFSWYSQVELPVCEVDLRFTPDEDSVLDALRQCLVGHESFWLILWDVDPDPHTYIEQMVLKPNRGMIDLESRGTFTDISLYSSHGHDIVSNFLKKQSVIPSCPDWS